MSLSQMNIRRAQVLLHTLHQSGVTDYVVSPGSRNTPLIWRWNGWPKSGHDGVRIHRILDERSAGFFALGLGRLKGVPAALICTSGSAAAIIFRRLSSRPKSRSLLVLSADRPQSCELSVRCKPLTKTSSISYAGSFSTWVLQISMEPNATRVSACGVRAVDAACGYNAGPVHLNLPF